MKPVTLFKVRKRTGEFIPDAIGIRVRKRRRVQEQDKVNASALELSNLTLNGGGNGLLHTTSLDNSAETGAMEYVMFRRVEPSNANILSVGETASNDQLDETLAHRNDYKPFTNDGADIPVVKLDSVSEGGLHESSLPKNSCEAIADAADDVVNEIALHKNVTTGAKLGGGCDQYGDSSATTLVLFARESHTNLKEENGPGYVGNEEQILEENLGCETRDGETVKVKQNEHIVVDQDTNVSKGGLTGGGKDQKMAEASEMGRTIYVDADELFDDGWYVALEGDSDEGDEDAGKGSRDRDDDDGSDLDARTVDYPSTPEEYSEEEDVTWRNQEEREGFSSDGGDYERYDQFADEYDFEC